MSPSPRHYSAEDVQAILSAAAELAPDELFSEKQLREMAAEMDIEPEVLDQAKQTWQADKRQQEKAALLKRRQRRQFRDHLVIYLLVNAGLVGLDVADGSLNWAFYPLMGWGIGLAIDGLSTLRQPQSHRWECRSAFPENSGPRPTSEPK